MSQKALDTAFIPFQSTKGTGRGLGLTTVDALLQGQPGRMQAFSRPGEGVWIVIDLPLGAALSPAPSVIDRDVHTTPKGAMVVDDDRFQADLVTGLLKEFGWDAVCFYDPLEALSVFKVAPSAFGLIITDRRMPQMSGDDLVPQLLEIQPDIPIILSSGALASPLPAGLAGTLPKPVSRETLWATLDYIGLKAPLESQD
jgi:CheY-like chemotaxis protein